MRKMKKDIIRFFIPAFCFAMLFPAVISAAPGGEAMPFTRVVRDPVAAAIGGTGVVSTSASAFASFRNAAAIPYAENTLDVAAGYMNWQPSASPVQDINAGASWNIAGKFGIALGLSYGLCEKYDIMDASGTAVGSFSPSQVQANLGMAWRFLPFLSLGANVKYLGNSLAEGKSYGAVASDIFFMTKVAGLRAAVGVSSLGSKVKSASGAGFSLPASTTLGLGYGIGIGKKHAAEVLVDADYYFSGAFSASAGAAYTYNDLVSVRAGYRYGGKSVIPSFVSVGAGVKFWGVHIDVAYIIAAGTSPLRNTFAVGLGYSF